MRFSCFPVLPGCAEAHVSSGGRVKRLLVAYFISNIFVKKISRSIHVCHSYSRPKVGRFLRQCILRIGPSHSKLLALPPIGSCNVAVSSLPSFCRLWLHTNHGKCISPRRMNFLPLSFLIYIAVSLRDGRTYCRLVYGMAINYKLRVKPFDKVSK